MRFWWVLVCLAFWTVCAAKLVGCAKVDMTQVESLLTHGPRCNQKLLALADHGGSCEERRLTIEFFVHQDPDCLEVYQDAGTGLVCMDPARDGGLADGH